METSILASSHVNIPRVQKNNGNASLLMFDPPMNSLMIRVHAFFSPPGIEIKLNQAFVEGPQISEHSQVHKTRPPTFLRPKLTKSRRRVKFTLEAPLYQIGG